MYAKKFILGACQRKKHRAEAALFPLTPLTALFRHTFLEFTGYNTAAIRSCTISPNIWASCC